TLGAEDGDLRWASAGILARIPDRALVVRGLHGLLQDGNPAQRKMALYCLRDFGARLPEAEWAAVRALVDDDQGVRLAAIAALPRLAVDRGSAAEHLVVVLESGDERARRAAAAALGALRGGGARGRAGRGVAGEGGARVRAALRVAAAAPDAALARAASGALRALGSTSDP